MTDLNLEPVKEENIVECRACLQEINSYSTYYNLFDCVEHMDLTIAEKLSNIARVQISESDELPKVICEMCYTLLQSAYSFATTVKKTDQLLRKKFVHTEKSEKEWPKPIQINSNITYSWIPHVEVKEEILSDEECIENGKSSNEHNVEIKIEPSILQEECEFNRPKINGVCSLNGMEEEYLNSPTSNEHVEPKEHINIKEEPVSAEEMEDYIREEDLSLECMLCTKTFNSVAGLKAHVITQHSYKGVKRKSDDSVPSPEKVPYNYVCQMCKRAFATSTDLMVHETCHNKCKCYLCQQSFSTFLELSRHRLTCTLIKNMPSPKPKDADLPKPKNTDSPKRKNTDSLKLNKTDFLKTKNTKSPHLRNAKLMKIYNREPPTLLKRQNHTSKREGKR